MPAFFVAALFLSFQMSGRSVLGILFEAFAMILTTAFSPCPGGSPGEFGVPGHSFSEAQRCEEQPLSCGACQPT